jgi:hypothetical protein
MTELTMRAKAMVERGDLPRTRFDPRDSPVLERAVDGDQALSPEAVGMWEPKLEAGGLNELATRVSA